MSKDPAVRPEDLVAGIDEALSRHPPLTEELHADVQRLRAKIHKLCQAGRPEEALRSRKLALEIIRSGGPVPE